MWVRGVEPDSGFTSGLMTGNRTLMPLIARFQSASYREPGYRVAASAVTVRMLGWGLANSADVPPRAITATSGFDSRIRYCGPLGRIGWRERGRQQMTPTRP